MVAGGVGAQSDAFPADFALPGAIKDGDDAVLRNVLDFRPFSPWELVMLVYGMYDAFYEEVCAT